MKDSSVSSLYREHGFQIIGIAFDKRIGLKSTVTINTLH